MWTITGAIIMTALPSHGFGASLDEAKMNSPRRGGLARAL
jgi:hypothetical protein